MRPANLEKSVVEIIRSITARFPERELDIRRRCVCDVQFRSVCADYEEAAAALRYWKKVAREGDRKIEEYSNFLTELESEILDRLDHSASTARHC
jgi:hypothetical protein